VTNIQQQRFYNEQLRREANIKRINLSQALEDIKVNLTLLN
jgi:hypothetical protein